MPFQAWHLEWLRLQNSQMNLSPLLTLEYGQSLKKAGPAFSAFAGMDVIACAGVVEFWVGRSQVWALLSKDWTAHLKSIHRAVKEFINKYNVGRLECVVDPRSAEAIRWAERLGFRVEHLMEAYTPQGEDQLMMTRIQR